MVTKVKTAPEEQVAQSNCRHYWVIEPPKGPTSRGVCQLCGAEKEFQNFMSDSWDGDQSSLFGLSGARNIEPDNEETMPEELVALRVS